jgi:hypothetical protein
MTILYKENTEKSYQRSQLKLSIIVDEKNIFNNIKEYIDINLIKIFIENKITSEEEELILQNQNIEKFQIYNTVKSYWHNKLKTIPKVKLDNRLKKGEYIIEENLILVVRNAERYKNQNIELKYDTKKNI